VRRSVILLVTAMSLSGLRPDSPGPVAKAEEKGCCEGTRDSGVSCGFPMTVCDCGHTGESAVWSFLVPQECYGEGGSGTCDCEGATMLLGGCLPKGGPA